jgi:hypothetical protein
MSPNIAQLHQFIIEENTGKRLFFSTFVRYVVKMLIRNGAGRVMIDVTSMQCGQHRIQ